MLPMVFYAHSKKMNTSRKKNTEREQDEERRKNNAVHFPFFLSTRTTVTNLTRLCSGRVPRLANSYSRRCLEFPLRLSHTTAAGVHQKFLSPPHYYRGPYQIEPAVHTKTYIFRCFY